MEVLTISFIVSSISCQQNTCDLLSTLLPSIQVDAMDFFEVIC